MADVPGTAAVLGAEAGAHLLGQRRNGSAGGSSAPSSIRRSESSSLLQLAQLVMRESGEHLPDGENGSSSGSGGTSRITAAADQGIRAAEEGFSAALPVER